MENGKIKIALAGHTNVGKTTLIRTFMRSTVGEVKDSANVTKVGAAYEFDSLQAIFVDTPGFQNAMALEMYLDGQSQNPNYELKPKYKEDLKLDLKAFETLKGNDVILYVATLTDVPKDSNGYEIDIVKKQCSISRVIAILNQRNKELQATNPQDVANREKQWKKLFEDNSISNDNVIIFDAHSDNPAKVKKIYDRITHILPNNESSIFNDGLNKFNDRQLKIRNETCQKLAELIDACQKEVTVQISKTDYDNAQKREETKQQLAKKIDDKYFEFVNYTSQLYELPAECPTTSKDELLLNEEMQRNWAARISWASAGSGIGATVVGAAGGVLVGVGMAAATLFTGGAIIPALVGGAMLGGTYGSIVGSVVGSLAVLSDGNDQCTLKIEREELQKILLTGLALIWGLSNHGYGCEQKMSLDTEKEIGKRIKQQVEEAVEKFGLANLDKANKGEIINYCEKILNHLEQTVE